ncbi:biliverdin-producing heme oxygenase [Sphingomonas quercus]|uniref:Biliverdin-producing heme oxygenase n=1 Tax=Sphingomonas quercus TaxID=2842451 RepID=A0ABS6BLQ4_9SPHN|nr:biliverdin-producing heme oxygenase [Sphingomonas quercus]MBU3079244.1 biliverdin-producing heme oxygenase [Sphingomonas quercus]
MQTAEAAPAGAFHHRLRADTRADHEAVDDRFGRFDLADADSYRQFLTAHSLVLPGFEAALAPAALMPGWEQRTAALADDLAALGADMPAPLVPAAAMHGAARWGAIYVVEGSRLGGAVLSRRVGAGLPAAYLSAVHRGGAWRRFLAAMDAAAVDESWRRAAIASARSVFAAYRRAADEARTHG